MNNYIVSKMGTALPNYTVFAKNRADAVKKAVALFNTRSVSVVKID